VRQPESLVGTSGERTAIMVIMTPLERLASYRNFSVAPRLQLVQSGVLRYFVSNPLLRAQFDTQGTQGPHRRISNKYRIPDARVVPKFRWKDEHRTFTSPIGFSSHKSHTFFTAERDKPQSNLPNDETVTKFNHRCYRAGPRVSRRGQVTCDESNSLSLGPHRGGRRSQSLAAKSTDGAPRTPRTPRTPWAPRFAPFMQRDRANQTSEHQDNALHVPSANERRTPLCGEF
jgi:hypothetical protein